MSYLVCFDEKTGRAYSFGPLTKPDRAVDA